jgi:hypothetical protein
MTSIRNPDGTYNGIRALSQMTGVSESKVAEIARIARENVQRLASCSIHAFEPVGPVAPLRTRYRCAACGGEVDSSAYRWYQQGRAHEAALKAALK